MEKPARYKGKNKKPAAKPKIPKKRKSEGPTCSTFLAEITRKLASKKKLDQEQEITKSIIETIIESITNALPFKFSKQSLPKKDSPMKMETLQTYAPELLPNDTLDVPLPPAPLHHTNDEDEPMMEEVESANTNKPGFKMPKMPLVNSEVIKLAVEQRKKMIMQDAAVNTGPDHDVASEIAKHVNTLRKISLIAEEFNQKTAKNLKEIVDSVQEDLVKKLEEIEAEQKASTSKSNNPTQLEEEMDE